MSMLTPPVPQLAPMIRARLKERVPQLQDEDLPTHAVTEGELIETIVRRTGDSPEAVREILYQVGVFVRPRPATERKGPQPAIPDDSFGSGIPDDTAQSGMMSVD